LQETLTGFKWLGSVAAELTAKGYHFLYAFEEAIGFMVGDVCRDKVKRIRSLALAN
jgi:phosphoglucomutase